MSYQRTEAIVSFECHWEQYHLQLSRPPTIPWPLYRPRTSGSSPPSQGRWSEKQGRERQKEYYSTLWMRRFKPRDDYFSLRPEPHRLRLFSAAGAMITAHKDGDGGVRGLTFHLPHRQILYVKCLEDAEEVIQITPCETRLSRKLVFRTTKRQRVNRIPIHCASPLPNPAVTPQSTSTFDSSLASKLQLIILPFPNPNHLSLCIHS